MFPWLAFGHIFPYLELAKLIAQRGHHVSFVSTPRNIQRLPKLPPNLAPLIKFVNLPLPMGDNLPENAEATIDVPYDVVPLLKQAYDGLQEPLTRFLESSKADWMFYDFAAFWAGSVASKMGAEQSSRKKLEDFTVPPPWVPFPTTVACHLFEITRSFEGFSDNATGVSDTDRFAVSIQNCDFVVVRGCTKFEPEWFQVLENIYQKPVIPVGQLPSTGFDDGDKNDTWQCMKDWLDKQARGSVVYVAFGSEMKPNQEEVTEIALGLEKSKLPFLWVLRLQRGPWDPDVLQLPEGFEERTQGRGVVCTTWAPQLKILGHVAIGGFMTHAGCSSVVEAVQTEKPLILLTFLVDQGLNARVLEEKKMGYTVPRNERDGSFTSDTVADSVRLVMVDEEGRIYREKIKELKDSFMDKERQERYIDELLHYLGTLSKC
ncbi:UDP-glycosyltransferase 91A1-like [Abrus precatorius]|uniref:UDP-glycosyltransferase 91A1-like n=1 Tax=Abrus precatorius TaxID=3816 RepID=A0A8B8KVV8_ABRPR|nr:UDP-glycosyltransferase 91A1-like [Abrus precatorius]